MQAGPDRDPEVRHGRTRGQGATDRPRRPIEQGEEAVARRHDLAATVGVDDAADPLVVFQQELSPGAVADPPERRSGVDDVGEQDRGEHPFVGGVGIHPEDARAREFDRVPGILADDPHVVARGDLVGIARSDLELRAVLHAHPQAARQHVADVAVLAPRGPGHRPDIPGPAPARTEHEVAHRSLIEVEQVDVTVGELADLVRRGQVLALETRHAADRTEASSWLHRDAGPA